MASPSGTPSSPPLRGSAHIRGCQIFHTAVRRDHETSVFGCSGSSPRGPARETRCHLAPQHRLAQCQCGHLNRAACCAAAAGLLLCTGKKRPREKARAPCLAAVVVRSCSGGGAHTTMNAGRAQGRLVALEGDCQRTIGQPPVCLDSGGANPPGGWYITCRNPPRYTQRQLGMRSSFRPPRAIDTLALRGAPVLPNRPRTYSLSYRAVAPLARGRGL